MSETTRDAASVTRPSGEHIEHIIAHEHCLSGDWRTLEMLWNYTKHLEKQMADDAEMLEGMKEGTLLRIADLEAELSTLRSASPPSLSEIVAVLKDAKRIDFLSQLAGTERQPDALNACTELKEIGERIDAAIASLQTGGGA